MDIWEIYTSFATRVGALVDLRLALVVGGAIGTVFSCILHKWPASKFAWWAVIVLGVLILFVGYSVWDSERKSEKWDLSASQVEALSSVLTELDPTEPFPIVFYPINGNNLSNIYAYQVYNSFGRNNWRVIMVSPNWAPPSNVGLSIAVCPALGVSSHVNERQLRRIFERAGIPLRHRIVEEDLGNRGCVLGLVVGQPPPPFER